jgi:hypothetical protein
MFHGDCLGNGTLGGLLFAEGCNELRIRCVLGGFEFRTLAQKIDMQLLRHDHHK